MSPLRLRPSRLPLAQTACSRAPSTKSVSITVETDHPTIALEYRSMTNAVHHEPGPGAHVGEVHDPALIGALGGEVPAQQVLQTGTVFGGVVRVDLPGPIPVSPRARMRRSTVHRATGSAPAWVLSSLQVFLAPSAALRALEARSVAMRSSRRASDSALADGGRLLAA